MSTAIMLFLFTYILIILGVIHRTLVAFAGAVAMLMIGAISPQEALKAMDFDTIGLLMGMMIIVGITKKTGLFEYLAIKVAQMAKGEPTKILSGLCLITAFFSAFLDNVTTVMLVIPVTFVITKQLNISPIPFLIAMIISSNIGGTATLVGDPPNIMISGFTGLGFMDFVTNLAPVVIIIYIVTILILKSKFQQQLVTFPMLKDRIISLKASDQLKDRVLLSKCLLVISLTVLGFIFHQQIKLEPAFIAIVLACFLIIITKSNIIKSLMYVEWSVIIFFISLFVMVGALDEIGVFERLARTSLDVTGGNILSAALIILWLSAIASAFVDNIPFVAAMIPLIKEFGQLGGIDDLTFFWWALSLGSCLGGNGTAIGASANVVVIGIAEKRGVNLSFIDYMKTGFPIMLLSIVISTGYLLLWYYLN
ncbi:MAG: ArsB/NhaD family transporter [Firmicutes bacterium]|nr:ArsB/NhaD family transporter [Bacillota bacterium]